MVKITDIKVDGYYRVVKVTCDRSDLRAVIAVHNVNLGPALGGCRVLDYDSFEAQLDDALRLSKGMTYKSAFAGNKLGGGKATIQAPLTEDKLLSFGRAMEELNKSETIYYTAADVGTSAKELEIVARETEFVNYKGQDCSIATAYGVMKAMEGALSFKNETLKGQNVSVLGYGKVGRRLSRMLNEKDASVIVSDIVDPFPTSPYGIKEGLIPNKLGYIDNRQAHYRGTVFAPCALGKVLTERVIEEMPRGHIICGAANNQLESPEVEYKLLEKDIIYVPDYVANAGGVIITAEQNGKLVDLDYREPVVKERLDKIADNVKDIFLRCVAEQSYPTAMANKMAEEIFNG